MDTNGLAFLFGLFIWLFLSAVFFAIDACLVASIESDWKRGAAAFVLSPLVSYVALGYFLKSMN